MSYPAPPGLASATPQPHASLPARPPPSTASPASGFKPSSSNGPARPAFTAFAPRSVAASSTHRTNAPAHYAALPTTSYSSAPQYQQPPQNAYQDQQQYDPPYGAAPQIRNPFVPAGTATSSNTYGAPADYDPEYEAQVLQWQSAYATKEDRPFTGGVRRDGPSGANTAPLGSASRLEATHPAEKEAAAKTVQRQGGGTSWQDSSLLEWDPAHFRIFVGNIAGEVTDESLLKAFAKYPSVQKARVIRDKRTTKSKGYGFVSFSDGDEYFQAAREMQGKYIGSHPVLLKRSTTEVRPTAVQQKGGKNGRYKGKGGNGGGKVENDGVQKKAPKTKGGLKVLG